MSLPAAGCRLNRADGNWCPLTRSSLSPLSRWHRDTKCELSARQADYYYTAATAAERGERRSCTVETGRGGESADWIQQAGTPQENRRNHGRMNQMRL
ncbi:hypothetical protein ABVT39_026257 [Epinephelus coioides]